jgi:hypothetical protein
LGTNIFGVEAFWVLTPCGVAVGYQRVTEAHATSIFRVPEDLDLKYHCRENLRIPEVYFVPRYTK